MLCGNEGRVLDEKVKSCIEAILESILHRLSAEDRGQFDRV